MAGSRAGRVELAVKRDLKDLDNAKVAEGAVAELALVLARAIDSGALTNSELVKAADSLRVTLNQLREVARDVVDGGPDGDFSTPSWDPAQPGAADVGSEGGGGRPQAG